MQFYQTSLFLTRHQRFFSGLAKRLPDVWWTHANRGLLARRLGREELAQQELAKAERLKKARGDAVGKP